MHPELVLLDPIPAAVNGRVHDILHVADVVEVRVDRIVHGLLDFRCQ